MSSGKESEFSSSFSLPPPSVVILSNLANQLIVDEHFYLAVLNLAKELGHSAVYERKVIVNPLNLCATDKYYHSSNIESLGGSFLWVPNCGTAEEYCDDDKEPDSDDGMDNMLVPQV